MRNKLEWLSIVLLIILVIIFIHFNEEKPHIITINGKNYIRSKEYTGNGTYQIILIPNDSVTKNNITN